jgi:serine/threonine protein kinase
MLDCSPLRLYLGEVTMLKPPPNLDPTASRHDADDAVDLSACAPSSNAADAQDTAHYLRPSTVSDSDVLGSDGFGFLDPPIQADELGWIGHYRVLELLGSGGMGLVFRAEDPRLKRPVAIKVLRPELAEDPVIRERFLREARATAALPSEHIIAIFDIGQTRDIPYVAAELLHGSPLDVHLQEVGALSPAEVVQLGLQIARGLEAAHQIGLIHRDIKPANIWVQEGTRRIKLLDFGLSRALEGEMPLTECGIVVGSPAYMAPEQANGQPVDTRCDLFSLGCVLYEAAAGKNPFEAADGTASVLATSTVNPPHLHEVAPRMPENLCDLIMELLAKNPEKRPSCVTEVVEDLQVLAATYAAPPTRLRVRKLTATQIAPALRAKRAYKKRLLAIYLWAALIGLIAVSAYFIFKA